jgi:hypothetical protein
MHWVRRRLVDSASEDPDLSEPLALAACFQGHDELFGSRNGVGIVDSFIISGTLLIVVVVVTAAAGVLLPLPH